MHINNGLLCTLHSSVWTGRLDKNSLKKAIKYGRRQRFVSFLQPVNLCGTHLNTSVHTFTTSCLNTHTHTRLSQANKSEELYFGYTKVYILPLQSVLIPLNASSDLCPILLLLFPPHRQGRTAGSSQGIRGRDDPVSPARILTEPSLSYPSNEQAQVSVFRCIPTLHLHVCPAIQHHWFLESL